MSTAIVTVHFVNKHFNPVNVSWDKAGVEQVVAVLRPGQSYRQAAEPGTRWCARDRVSSKLLRSLVARGDEQVIIKDEIRRIDPDEPESPYINATGSQVGVRAPQFALLFDGEGDVVVVPPHDGLDLVASWTLEAWIFRNGRGSEQILIEKCTSRAQQDGFCLKVADNDCVQGGIFTGGDFVYVQGSTALEAMRWYHVAVSFNGESDELRCYLDGKIDGVGARISRGASDNRAVIQFDGVDDYISVPQLKVSRTAYSACFWFKTEQKGAGLFCVDAGIRGEGGSDRHIFLDESGNLRARLLPGETIGSTGRDFADNRWHHVVHTFGGDVGGQRLYVDGELLASGSRSAADFSAQEGLNLGFSPAAPRPHFAGQLAEVAVWSIPFRESYVKASWRMRLRGDEAGLEGLWRLDSGYGATYPDASPAQRAATLEGPPLEAELTAIQLSGGYIDGGALNLGGKSFTLSLWARRAESGGTQSLMAQGQAAATGLFFGFVQDQLCVTLAGRSCTAAKESDLAWHHYACQLDRASGTLSLFRDGVLVASCQGAPEYAGTGALLIGKAPWDGKTLRGQVAELAVWELARGLGGINQDRDVGPLGTEDGMVAMWARALLPDQTPGQLSGLWNFARSRQHAQFCGAATASLAPRPYALPKSAPRWNRFSELRLVPFDLVGRSCRAPLGIGGRSQDGSSPFKGIIDSVRIWSTARSAAEVGACWNQELTGSEAGLRAYFPFDEGSGLLATDHSSAAHQAALGRGDVDSRPAWTESTLLLMDGLRFDGVDDWVSLPPMAADFSQGFTAEVWVYLDDLRAPCHFIDLGNGAELDNIVLASAGPAADLVLSVYRGVSGEHLTARSVLRTKEWLHVAGTIDDAGTARLYVNGKEVAAGPLRLPLDTLRRKNYLGRSHWKKDGYFKGILDELRLWQVARSVEQIEGYLRRRLSPGDTRLLALFPCDEGSGAVIFDNSANGLHGLLGGGEAKQQPTWMRQGERDEAGLRFDGIDDYVSVPAQPFHNLPQGTIELWLCWEGQSSSSVLGTQDGNAQVQLFLPTDGRLQFSSWAGGPVAQSLAALWPRKWYHVAVVFGPRQAQLYLDGVLDRTVAGDFSIPQARAGATAALGSAGTGRGSFFAGILDEVRIWSVERNRIQLQANMNRRVAADSPGLVAYYPIADGAGVNLYDQSSSGHHGTLGGGQEAQRPLWIEASPVQFEGMKFNGAGDYLSIPSSAALNVCSGFSLSAWVRPGMFQGLQTVAAKALDARDCQYALSLEGEMLRFDYERAGNNYALVGGQLRDGWSHVAVTITPRLVDTPVARLDADGNPEHRTVTAANGVQVQCPVVEMQKLDEPEIRLYVNGLQVAVGPAPAATLPSDAPFTIGALCTSEKKDNFFYGIIDSVLVHDAVLTQIELQEVMNRRLPDYAPRLRGYFRLPTELGIGEAVVDRAGRSESGTRHFFERFSAGDDPPAPQGTLDLCGADSVMVLTDPPELSAFTVEMWIKLPLPAYCVLLDGRWLVDAEDYAGRFQLSTDNEGLLAASLPQDTLNLPGGGAGVNLNELPSGWHHLALVFDPRNELDVLRAVVDGKHVLPSGVGLLELRRLNLERHGYGRTPRARLPSDVRWRPRTFRTLTMGIGPDDPRRLYSGSSTEVRLDDVELAVRARIEHIGNSAEGGSNLGPVDEVRLWDHPRTDGQLRELMRQRLLGLESGLCGYWRFEEGTGNLTKDYTPRGKAAELRGEFRWQPQSDLHLPLAVFRPRNEMTALELRPEGKLDANIPQASWGIDVFSTQNFGAGTLMLFIAPEAPPEGIDADAAGGIVMLCGGSAHGNAALWLRGDGHLVAAVGDQSAQHLVTNLALPQGRFSHVAFTWNDSRSHAALYVNGICDCQVQLSSSLGWMIFIDGFRFGPRLSEWQPVASEFPFAGRIGQVALFGRELAPAEMASWASRAIFRAGQDPLVAWLFEQAPLELGREPASESDGEFGSDFASEHDVEGEQPVHGSGRLGWADRSGISLPPPETCVRLENQREDSDQHEHAFSLARAAQKENAAYDQFQLRQRMSLEQDGVDLGSSDTLRLPAGEFSLEVWLCQVERRQGELTPLFHLSGSQDRDALTLGLHSGRLALQVGETPLHTGCELSLETWHHVALSIIEQGDAGLLYLNGRLVHQFTGLGKCRFGGDLRLGYRPILNPSAPEETPRGFRGLLADVALWSRERTGPEIARDCRERLSPTEPGLIGYWRLDGVSGRYALDSAIGRHHGLLIGGASWHRREQLAIQEAGTPAEPSAQALEALKYLESLPTPSLPETVASKGALAPDPSQPQPGAVFAFCSLPEDAARVEVQVAPGVKVAVTALAPNDAAINNLPAPFGALARALAGAIQGAEGSAIKLESSLLGDFDPLALLGTLSPEFLKLREPKLKLIGSADGGDGMVGRTLGLRLSGNVSLAGLPPIILEADFYKLEDGGGSRKLGYMLKFHLPEPFGLGSLLGNIPVIGGIQFYRPAKKFQASESSRLLAVVVTNDQVASMRMLPGVNFYGTLRIASSEDPAFRFIGQLFHIEELQIHVVMARSMLALDAVLGIDLEIIPGKLWFKEMGVGMKVVMTPPESQMSVFSTLEAQLGADKLRFTGQLGVQQTKGVSLVGSLSMEGMWRRPFGIQGVAIGDLAAQVAVKAEFPWLDQLGVTGRLQLGRASALIAVLIDSNDPDKCVFIGDATSVKLTDIVNTLCGPGIVPGELTSVLDRFELRRLKISIVPTPAFIGSFQFNEKGITIKVAVTLYGWSGDLHLRVDYNDGITGYATIDPISIAGLIELRESRDEKGVARTRMFRCANDCPQRRPNNLQLESGACQEDLDGKPCGRTLAPKPGPQMYLSLSPFSTPELYISGYASVLGINADTFIHLQKSGLVADLRGTLWGLFDARLRLKVASNLSYVYVRADLRNDFYARLREEAVRAIQGFTKQAENELDQAMQTIRAAQQQVDRCLLELEDMRRLVKQEREAISQRLRQAQDALDGAQRSVNGLLYEIQSTIQWYGSLPDVSWPWNASKARDWVWVGPKLAGLYIAYGVATAALTVAKGMLACVDFLVLNIPLDMDPRIVALWTKYGVCTAGLTTAQAALAATKGVVRGFAWVLEQVVRLALGELFDVRSAMFEGEFSSARSAMKVNMVADIVFLKMNLHVQFEMDFSNVAGTADRLVRGLIAQHAA